MSDFNALDLLERLSDDPVVKSLVQKARAVKFEPTANAVRVWTTDKKFWEVRKDNDGDLYCSCPAWRFSKLKPRKCKHLLAVSALYDVGKLQTYSCKSLSDNDESAWWKA